MIKVEGLSKIYDTGAIKVKALDDIDLFIDDGEFVAITGASGSGKSTLMNILGCLDLPTSGKYSLAGVDVENKNDDELSEIRNLKIGFVFQSFNLIPRTSALKNVELPMVYSRVPHKERTLVAKEALEKVGLAERINHLPNELSGGQKQRVAIARALVNKPSILLADEPTGNLDSKSTTDIMNLFKELNDNGITIIIVTHEPEVAQQCKRVITFKDGKIIDDYKVGENAI